MTALGFFHAMSAQFLKDAHENKYNNQIELNKYANFRPKIKCLIALNRNNREWILFQNDEHQNGRVRSLKEKG